MRRSGWNWKTKAVQARELAQNPVLDYRNIILGIRLREGGGLLALSELSQRAWVSRVWGVREVATGSGA